MDSYPPLVCDMKTKTPKHKAYFSLCFSCCLFYLMAKIQPSNSAILFLPDDKAVQHEFSVKSSRTGSHVWKLLTITQ